uniref:Uncharacterized protein n=1 Tax=Cacopsylla melanoneura TaxID=428564 RepID=A0A8D8ZXC2_9HEMI
MKSQFSLRPFLRWKLYYRAEKNLIFCFRKKALENPFSNGSYIIRFQCFHRQNPGLRFFQVVLHFCIPSFKDFKVRTVIRLIRPLRYKIDLFLLISILYCPNSSLS